MLYEVITEFALVKGLQQGVVSILASSFDLFDSTSVTVVDPNAPIRQSLAVTGSINQFGDVQAIGAVNEKIEGFFDICKARGLTGEQGVLIPSSNLKHLMLRDDVVAACAERKFSIYAVKTVDEAIEVLTGLPAETINTQVSALLAELSSARREFAGDQRRNNFV